MNAKERLFVQGRGWGNKGVRDSLDRLEEAMANFQVVKYVPGKLTVKNFKPRCRSCGRFVKAVRSNTRIDASRHERGSTLSSTYFKCDACVKERKK